MNRIFELIHEFCKQIFCNFIEFTTHWIRRNHQLKDISSTDAQQKQNLQPNALKNYSTLTLEYLEKNEQQNAQKSTEEELTQLLDAKYNKVPIKYLLKAIMNEELQNEQFCIIEKDLKNVFNSTIKKFQLPFVIICTQLVEMSDITMLHFEQHLKKLIKLDGRVDFTNIYTEIDENILKIYGFTPFTKIFLKLLIKRYLKLQNLYEKVKIVKKHKNLFELCYISKNRKHT